MTAQVAVLSAQGIAVASDSAVTIVARDRGNRSYPSADKIFALPGVPVAVMHSGNASLRGVPWKLLIERWGIERDQIELDTMASYADELLAWLVKQEYFASDEAQDDTFRWMYRDYLLSVRNGIREALIREGISLEAGYLTDTAEAAVADDVVQSYLARLHERPDVAGFSVEIADALVVRLTEELREDFEWVFDDVPRTRLLDSHAVDIAKTLILKAEPFDLDATLAIVGYGREAFFPSSWQGTVTAIVAGLPRLWDVSETQISQGMRVTINPYGLTDAIHMFLRGTSSRYLTTAHHALEALADELGVAEDDKAQQDVLTRAHDQLVERFDDLEWTEFLKPMLDVAETLPLAELVRLADSLVGLASLRQMINGDASVGGPVDLARITKNRGFEWVRRKTDV